MSIIKTTNREEVIQLHELVGQTNFKDQFSGQYPPDKNFYEKLWYWWFDDKGALSGNAGSGALDTAIRLAKTTTLISLLEYKHSLLKIDDKYKSTFGTWEVSTEGDVEGRSVTQLGKFKGHIDEIAFHLADKCYYSLRFRPVTEDLDVKFVPKKNAVNVSFDIESNTWDLKSGERAEEMRKLFIDRPVSVAESSYYSGFKLITINPQQTRKELALAKLTEEDKKVLGITE